MATEQGMEVFFGPTFHRRPDIHHLTGNYEKET